MISLSRFCCLIFQIGCLDEEMDSCDSDDGVEEEKVNLLGRNDLFLGIANLFQLIEFFISVALISWSLFRLSSVLKVSGDNLSTFSSNLLNQHVVFLVGNVISVMCYVLSRRVEEGNRSEKNDEKYISVSQRKTTEVALIGDSVTPPPEETPMTEERSGEEKPNQTESETAMEVVIKQAVRQIERFRRTQSEKLKREMSIKPHRELRRSATAGRSSVDERSTAVSSEMVEKMSSEEFQLAVESFISKQQSFLKQEGIAENGTKL
ncbi:hypothetical protein L1987_08580 [Smallanthus sonchifolius]|uniref:Uncharacterized protein n=1 Tax=Smallanthus sonchifolius TaxID=185202 RepID=A0ACB9JL26_9ASTR|nr:hypothetical protein L1987_08580 [Smallanthus sonchifolius]